MNTLRIFSLTYENRYFILDKIMKISGILE